MKSLLLSMLAPILLSDKFLNGKGIKEAKSKVKVEYYELLRINPSGKYGWFRTNVGEIKKPIHFKEFIVPESNRPVI